MASAGLVRQNWVIGVSTALTAISVIIVGLRTFTRAVILHNAGNDDYAMIAAVIFTVGYLGALFVLRDNMMGFRGKEASFAQAVTTLQVAYAIEIIYYICVNIIKVSIVLFYLRFAVKKPFERLCKGTMYLLITFCLVCIIVILVQCRPLHKSWDLTGMVEGKCINTTIFIYTTSALNIVLDVWILVLPLNVLLSIQRPGREKTALLAIFALGGFSCIASIVRIYSVRVFTASHDPFYDSVPINTWSMVEINIGIWCASIPALKALFSKSQRVRTQNTLTHGYQFHGSERSGTKKSMGTIIRNDEFALEEIASRDGSSERIVRKL